MPLNSRLTNPGRTLKNHYFGGDSDTVREIPPEFRAALNLTILEIPLPWDQEIIPLSDMVLASKAEQKATSEWIRRTTYKPPGPIQLVEKTTNRDKQVVTRTRNFKFVGDPVGIPGPFTDVETKNLGNLHFIENVEDSGSVFANRTSTKEILDLVPEIFRATVPMFENKSTFTAPITIPQILGPGEQYRSETEEDIFNISRTVKGRFGIAYPVIVVSYKMTPEQQVETITDRLALGSQALVPTSLMIEGASEDLGDGSSWLHTGVVPSIFSRLQGETTIPDLIPPEFRGILPLQTLSTTFTGTALAEPVLGLSELSRKEEQLTVFNMRRTVTGRDPTALPKNLTSFKITKDKQIATVVATLDTGLQSLSGLIDELTTEAEVLNLGNNLSLKRLGHVASLFEAKIASIEVPDLVPPEFRAFLPTKTREVNVAGFVIDPPVLGIGDLEKTEVQSDVYTKRVRTKGRAGVTLPQIHSNPLLITEFGGGIANKTIKLDTAGVNTVDEGLTVLKSSITDLGNGMEIKETLELIGLAWPTLFGLEFNKDMQVYTPTEEQVVAPSYVSPSLTNAVESLKPIDKWRTQRKRVTMVPIATGPGSAIISYRYHPFQFPGTLDYGRLITYDHKEGFRKASALLAKHTVRTWWVTGATPPTVGDQDLGTFDIDVKEIISDTVNVPIFREGDTTGAETFTEVLHDDITNTLGAFYPATTPSFTKYYRGDLSGVTGSTTILQIAAPGNGYTVGDVLTVGASHPTVIAVGVAGSIVGVSNPTVPPSAVVTGLSFGATGISASGGSGSGAAFNELIISWTGTVAGTAWVGTEKVVAADIGPTEIPGQWKVVTESVVMR